MVHLITAGFLLTIVVVNAFIGGGDIRYIDWLILTLVIQTNLRQGWLK